MKIIITITLSLLLITGCAIAFDIIFPVRDFAYLNQTDNIVNGYDWLRMNRDQKVFYLKGYGEGFRSGVYDFAQYQLPCRDTNYGVFISNHDNSYGRLRITFIKKLVRQYYYKKPKLREHTVVSVLGRIVSDGLAAP